MSTGFTRRRFIALGGMAAAGFMMGGAITGCTQKTESEGADTAAKVDYENWEAVLAAAKGQTVSWYGWGGSEPRNTWITTVLAPALKEKYDVTLNLVGMDINDILTQLSGEMQAGREEGTIDFIWINGENFYSSK
ncbi:MAG: ABC transporter substrate-binding protein, partial [Coriobacteriaceae bacterium]|nr:ABC transporter substrate-binding protein [Coriobacteriaceae bacterium]